MAIRPLDSSLPPLPDMPLSCDEFLNRAYHLYQPKQGYRFGTGKIVLAAAVGRIMAHAEFGAGAGAVSVAFGALSA